MQVDIINEIESWPFVRPGWLLYNRNTYRYMPFTNTVVDIGGGKIEINGSPASLQDVRDALFKYATDQLKVRATLIVYFHAIANNIVSARVDVEKIIDVTPHSDAIIIGTKYSTQYWCVGTADNFQGFEETFGRAYPLLPGADEIVKELTRAIDTRSMSYRVVDHTIMPEESRGRACPPVQLTYMLAREDVIAVIRTLPQPIAEEIEAVF